MNDIFSVNGEVPNDSNIINHFLFSSISHSCVTFSFDGIEWSTKKVATKWTNKQKQHQEISCTK